MIHVERPCACGCGERIVTWNRHHRFVSNTHAQRFRRRQRPRIVITRAMRRRWAREAVRSRIMGYTLRLLAEVAHLDRDAAIMKAWHLGKRQAYRDRARAQRQVAA